MRSFHKGELLKKDHVLSGRRRLGNRTYLDGSPLLISHVPGPPLGAPAVPRGLPGTHSTGTPSSGQEPFSPLLSERVPPGETELPAERAACRTWEVQELHPAGGFHGDEVSRRRQRIPAPQPPPPPKAGPLLDLCNKWDSCDFASSFLKLTKEKGSALLRDRMFQLGRCLAGDPQ